MADFNHVRPTGSLGEIGDRKRSHEVYEDVDDVENDDHEQYEEYEEYAEEYDDDSEHVPEDLDEDYAVHEAKRPRRVETSPRVAVIHRVVCNGNADRNGSHFGHERECLYFDSPRLFHGDSKASPLRGSDALKTDMEEYLEEHAGVVMVLYKYYDCQNYHLNLDGTFTRILPRQLDRKLFRNNRHFFYVLDSDGPPAVPMTQVIEITSGELSEAMSRLTLFGSSSDELESRRNLTSPFPYFFHHGREIRELVDERLLDQYANLVELLLNLVEATCQEEYVAARQLFTDGMVTSQHLGKLFCHNEVVVNRAGGEPTAWEVEEVVEEHGRIALRCWRWAFDGMFTREKTSLVIPFPKQRGERMPISDLPVYPLRCDRSGMSQRLLDRGQKFWDCRKRQFVLYSAPTSPFEAQTVSNSRSFDPT